MLTLDGIKRFTLLLVAVLINACASVPLMGPTPVIATPTVDTGSTLAACHQVVSDFTESICGAIVRSGSSESSEAKTVAAASDALFDQEVQKLAGDNRVRITRKRDSYVGVIREHLPEELKSVRECRKDIAIFAYDSCETEQQDLLTQKCTTACREEVQNYQYEYCLMQKNEACNLRANMQSSSYSTSNCERSRMEQTCKNIAAQKLHSGSGNPLIQQCKNDCVTASAK